MLTRAAEVRAILIGSLNTHGSSSINGLCDFFKEQFGNLGANKVQVRNILDRLVENGTVKKRRDGATAIYYIQEQEADVTDSTADEKQTVDKNYAHTTQKRFKIKKANEQPALIIDIVKSTGRIRLDVGGFVIDIGIKE